MPTIGAGTFLNDVSVAGALLGGCTSADEPVERRKRLLSPLLRAG